LDENGRSGEPGGGIAGVVNAFVGFDAVEEGAVNRGLA
jgi:hypothetical protein